MKTCDHCNQTNETVIRYPLSKMDTTIKMCDKCAKESGYTFH